MSVMPYRRVVAALIALVPIYGSASLPGAAAAETGANAVPSRQLPAGPGSVGPLQRTSDGTIAVRPPTSQRGTRCELSALAGSLADLEPGRWRNMQGTAMRPILLQPDDRVLPQGAWGVRGSAGVISAWNSAAFDGCRWYFMGGGHLAYGGNEVYRFDLGTLVWSRLTDPTPYLPAGPSNRCPGLVDPTLPIPGHSYDGFIHSQRTGMLYYWANAIFCDERSSFVGGLPTNPAGGRSQMFEFDPVTLRWTWLHKPPDDWYFSKTAEDSVRGTIIHCTVRTCREFDPLTKTYARESPKPDFIGRLEAGAAAFDKRRRQIVIIGYTRIFAAPVDGATIGKLAVVRETSMLGDLSRYGIAYDPERDTFALWAGNRAVYTLDPETWAVRAEPAAAGTSPVSGTEGVFGRWVYIPALRAFMGIDNVDEGFWIYRLAATSGQEVVDPTITTCTPDAQQCSTHTVLANALAAAQPGDVVTLAPGTYLQAARIATPNVTVRGTVGPTGQRAHLLKTTIEGKAALVVAAAGVTIEGLECSQIAVQDENGACIRAEAPNLIVRNVYFHDNQQGLLGGEGRVVVEDSVFERNGNIGRAHGLYVSARVTEFVLRNSRVIATTGSGHGVKSRAAHTLVEHNVIAGLGGTDSRAIDVPDGGTVTIRNNVLQKGPRSDNADLIGIALEDPTAFHDINSTEVTGNVMIFDRPGIVFASRSPGSVRFENNVVIGPAAIGIGTIGRDNRWFRSRASAGMEPFPVLPAVPVR